MGYFYPGEIFPAKSEFEIKKEEAYKSTGVFENMYRYDPFIKASATGLFLTGSIATGAYFAPSLKYSATNLFINSYQSDTTLYNSAVYFSTTTKGLLIEGAVWGVGSTIFDVGSPDIGISTTFSTLFSIPVSFVTQRVIDTYYNISNFTNSIDTLKIDTTTYKLYQTTLPPITIPKK